MGWLCSLGYLNFRQCRLGHESNGGWKFYLKSSDVIFIELALEYDQYPVTDCVDALLRCLNAGKCAVILQPDQQDCIVRHHRHGSNHQKNSKPKRDRAVERQLRSNWISIHVFFEQHGLAYDWLPNLLRWIACHPVSLTLFESEELGKQVLHQTKEDAPL